MRRRVVFAGLLAVALYFSIFGGEYSVLELRRIRAEARTDSIRVEELVRQVDSLRRRVEALETDPFELERIARERYGMIRPGEVLYRITDSTSADGGSLDTPPPAEELNRPPPE